MEYKTVNEIKNNSIIDSMAYSPIVNKYNALIGVIFVAIGVFPNGLGFLCPMGLYLARSPHSVRVSVRNCYADLKDKISYGMFQIKYKLSLMSRGKGL